jgi:hypothetical protein
LHPGLADGEAPGELSTPASNAPKSRTITHQDGDIMDVPLNKLKESQRSAWPSPQAQADIAALAASNAVKRVPQALVEPERLGGAPAQVAEDLWGCCKDSRPTDVLDLLAACASIDGQCGRHAVIGSRRRGRMPDGCPERRGST